MHIDLLLLKTNDSKSDFCTDVQLTFKLLTVDLQLFWGLYCFLLNLYESP